MPKPIIVIEVGSIHHDLFCKSLEFMLTSHLTASIREEYHILMFNETNEERCYILSANEKPVYIDPPPHSVDKLKTKIEDARASMKSRGARYDNIESSAAKFLESNPVQQVMYCMEGAIIPDSTIKQIRDYPGAAFTFEFNDNKEMYIASIDFTGYNAKNKL